MYNLIKSGVVTIKGKEKRIIDSDAIYTGEFRPLVFEKVEEIETEEENDFSTAVSEEEITEEDGLTQEQANLLFHTDSDEAAVQMLLNRQQGEKNPNKSAEKKEKQPKSLKQTVNATEKQLKAAKEEAEKILAEAKEEAEQIISQAREEAKKQKEEAEQNGFDEGYQEGMSQAANELEAAQRDFELKVQQLQEEYAQQIFALEPEVVEFIIEVVKKLTGVILSDRKEIITHVVSDCLEGIERSNVYLIHVSREDYHNLLERKKELEQLVEAASEIKIVEDASLSKHQCMIESDTTIYDSSLDLQLERLCEDLRMLSMNSEE